MIFTIIGNRNTPAEICNHYVPVVKALLKAGHVGRSGGALGMDHVLTRAIEELRAEGFNDFDATVYIPTRRFNGLHWGNLGHRVHYVGWFKNYAQATEMASQYHDVWHLCDEFSRQAHARNMYEVLGTELAVPSDFIITYAKTNRKGIVTGGTGTAIKLAQTHQIPIFNEYVTSFDELEEFLKERGIENVELDYGE